jgi:hypothetical protein
MTAFAVVFRASTKTKASVKTKAKCGGLSTALRSGRDDAFVSVITSRGLDGALEGGDDVGYGYVLGLIE